MNRFQWIWAIYLGCSLTLYGQENLIPNPGFEDFRTCVNNVESAMADATPWYIVNQTPDLIQFDCDNDLPWNTNPAAFPNTAFEGSTFLFISGGASLAGGFSTEAVGVPLISPLEAGQPYLFSARVRARAFGGAAADYCADEPHHFAVFLNRDSFRIREERVNLALRGTSTSARRVITNSSVEVSPQAIGLPGEEREWVLISDCFVAEGGETHLGISHNIGKFEAIACTVPLDSNDIGTLFGFGFSLDDFYLAPLELAYEGRDTTCPEDPKRIDLSRFVPQPFFEFAEFIWPDGRIVRERVLARPGNYAITVRVPCAEFVLNLTVVAEDCSSGLYVPNVFSPNGDGINDIFTPEIVGRTTPENYRLTVYNRWGGIAFTTQDPEQGWNGFARGRAVEPGVFLWQLSFGRQQEDGSIRKVTRSGSVTVLRQ